MSRSRNSIPSYLPHSQSGRARAVWTDRTGVRRFRLLPGTYNSPESRNAFARLLLELDTAPPRPPVADPGGLTLAELLLAYLDHAERHYRTPDGKPTSEIYEVRVAIRALRELYADTLVAAFGPLCVKAARQRWVTDGRSRTECNRRVSIVKRIFKWAVSEELAPAGVYGVPGGRRRACAPEGADSGPVWLYRPPHHKNAHRRQSRTIAIGPRAQDVLRAFFTPDPSDYLFSPARTMAEHRGERTANRKTKRFPSHMARNAAKRVKHPKRAPVEKYNTQTYGLAVDRACDRAFPPPVPLAPRADETQAGWQARLTDAEWHQVRAWRKAHRWHPNQLRHAFAT